jgi:hypothetical protein
VILRLQSVVLTTNGLNQLALAIEQAAELIKDNTTGGPNIAMTYEEFRTQQSAIPNHPAGLRSDIARALGTLWNMRFTNLSRNSLATLSVLSLLSPGKSPIWRAD